LERAHTPRMPPVATYAIYSAWHSSSAAEEDRPSPVPKKGTLDAPVETVAMGVAHAPTSTGGKGAARPRFPSPAMRWIAALVMAVFLVVAVWHFAAHDDLKTHAQQEATSAEAEEAHAMLTE
jgi:hypothetical protein